MNDYFFNPVKKLMKATIITLQILIIIGIFSFFNQDNEILITIILFLLLVVINYLIIMLIHIGLIIFYYPRVYLKSKHFDFTKRVYKSLNNSEKYTYYVSYYLELKLGLTVEYSLDSDEHLFFELNDRSYSLVIKDYQGTILKSTDSQIWEIGYKKSLKGSFKKIISVNNPIHQNKRIMDRNYLGKYDNLVNIVLISNRSKTLDKVDGVYQLNEFIKQLKGK